MKRHILSVLVDNRPSVLARVSGLFSRRAFNIVSFAVAPTEKDEISRMTVVVDADEEPLEQIVKQLNKLINVLKVIELDDAPVERELMLVKVHAVAGNRHEVVDIVNLFRARVVDVSAESVLVEAVGKADKLEALLDLLAPYGIVELAKSGSVALSRGAKTTNA